MLNYFFGQIRVNIKIIIDFCYFWKMYNVKIVHAGTLQ